MREAVPRLGPAEEEGRLGDGAGIGVQVQLGGRAGVAVALAAQEHVALGDGQLAGLQVAQVVGRQLQAAAAQLDLAVGHALAIEHAAHPPRGELGRAVGRIVGGQRTEGRAGGRVGAGVGGTGMAAPDWAQAGQPASAPPPSRPAAARCRDRRRSDGRRREEEEWDWRNSRTRGRPGTGR
jgi:hypothetical protein